MNTLSTRRILSSRPLKGDYASKREREASFRRREYVKVMLIWLACGVGVFVMWWPK